MASCTTAYWDGNNQTTPRVRLTVTQSSSDNDSVVLSWVFEYIARYAISTSITHSCTATVNGTKVVNKIASDTYPFEGGYVVNGKTGTHTIASGTIEVAKGKTAKNVSFSCSMDFTGIKWSDTYRGSNMTAEASISVAAKTSYTVSYNANGGSGAPSSQTKWYGETLTLSSTKPTRTGYSFQGWALSKNDADDGTWYYQPGGGCGKNEDLALYAVWKANTYPVNYNANGGSGAPSSQTKTYGVTLKLSNATPTRTNYTFKGWGTSASATTVSYAPGANYNTNAGITLYAIWELSYAKPRITNISVARCDVNGDLMDEGTYANVSFDWVTDRTISSISIEAVMSEGVVQRLNPSASGTSGSVNVIFGSGALNNEITYTIRIIVTDSVDHTRKSATLPGLKFIIDCKRGGTGVSFGKPAELDEFVGFGWDACFNNVLGIHGVDLDGNVKRVFQPQNENGNTVIGWDNYNISAGNTNIYGHDIMFGVSNLASKNTFKPYIRRGDSFNVTIYTSGFFTNSGTDLYFFVPLTRPVIGSPTVTATSREGFQLRQNGKYTCGSSASVHTFPTSYSVTDYWTYGIQIKATFSDTTNVDNNDTVGVRWSGTLTFT